ncbi:MAG: hypothetical protein DMG59_15085 [Acidobacteria bacterium]|jgi:hypothetical protein|nr:MAG: hypothetical protein DMG59_15085 [Acidobacteriota bacterium]
MGIGGFEQAIWYLNILATIAVLISLYRNGLYRNYRRLYIYLLVDTLQSSLGALFQSRRKLYAQIYMTGQAMKLIIAVFVVLELYWLALAGHPALARFGRKTVRYLLPAAGVIALAGLLVDPSAPPGRSPVLHQFFSIEHTMDTWLLVFLTLICLFMAWFPVRLRRNVALYIGGFFLYFFARFSGVLLTKILPASFTHPLSAAMLSISFLCLIVWLFALRRQGEETTTVIGHRWNPARMERLTGQLEAINASLSRLGQ